MIGIQISSLAKLLTSAENVARAAETLARMGYRAAQLQWIAPCVPARAVADALAQNHMISLGTQEKYDDCAARLDAFIEMNRACASRDVCFSGIPLRFHTEEGVRAYISEMKGHIARLEAEGMRASYHPVAADFFIVNGAPAAETVLESLPALSLVPDTNQLIRAGVNAPEWILSRAGRAEMIHFKDMESPAEGARLTPVGQGCSPFPAIYAACKKAGIQTVLVEQETWQGDPYECMRASYAYVRALEGGA